MALNKKKLLGIEQLVANPWKKKQDIARELGVDPATFSRWQQDPEFKEAYQKKMDEEWADTIRKAKRKAVELLDSPSDQVKLGATKLILDKALADKQEVTTDGFNITIGYDEDKSED